MRFRWFEVCSRTLAFAGLASLPLALAAQDSQAGPEGRNSGDNPSRWDIFAGYSYLAPREQ